MSYPPPEATDRSAAAALNPAEAIEALLARLETAAREDRTPAEFYEPLVREMVAALGGTSGAAWVETDQGLVCLARVGPAGPSQSPALSPESERPLAAAVLTGGAPCLLDPGAAFPETDLRNESAGVQCLVPRTAEGVPGVVLRVELRPQAPLYLRETAGGLLAAAADIALIFQSHRRLRELHRQDALWRELAVAIREMHAARTVSASAQVVAREVRRLLPADRVSVLLVRGNRCRLAAVSSDTEPDHRARQVRLLERVAREAVQSGRSFEVAVGTGINPLRVAESMDDYLDETQVRAVRCELLTPPVPPDSAASSDGRPIAVLVCDAYTARETEEWRNRLPLLTPHCAQALQGALEKESRGWRRWLTPWRWWSRAAAWGLVLAVVVGALVALTVLPAELTIEVPGRLMPVHRRGVFAPADAIVAEVLVRDEERVHAGQPLVRLIDPDLELEASRLQGELQTALARLDAVQARRKLRLQDRSVDASLLSIEQEELKATIDGLRQQLEVVRQRREQLTILSPLAGRVARWNLQQMLHSLPVRHGQNLMDVYDPEGPWQLELDVPDDVSGYVRLVAAGGPPRVEFVLQTDPARVHAAVLDELGDATELNADHELTVRGIVKLPSGLIDDPRRGATVQGKIYCGRRSLGFVWFRELIEFVQRRILF